MVGSQAMPALTSVGHGCAGNKTLSGSGSLPSSPGCFYTGLSPYVRPRVSRLPATPPVLACRPAPPDASQPHLILPTRVLAPPEGATGFIRRKTLSLISGALGEPPALGAFLSLRRRCLITLAGLVLTPEEVQH